MNKVHYYFFCYLFLSACNTDRHTPLEYKRFIENPENGFVQSCVIGDTPAQVTLVDNDYLAIQYFRSNEIDALKFQEVKDSYKGYVYFKIRLGNSENNTLEAMNSFYDHEFQDHLRLIAREDTLRCSFYLSEPFNGIKKEKELLVGFPVPPFNPAHVQIWIRPILNFHVGTTLNFDLTQERPPLTL